MRKGQRSSQDCCRFSKSLLLGHMIRKCSSPLETDQTPVTSIDWKGKLKQERKKENSQLQETHCFFWKFLNSFGLYVPAFKMKVWVYRQISAGQTQLIIDITWGTSLKKKKKLVYSVFSEQIWGKFCNLHFKQIILILMQVWEIFVDGFWYSEYYNSFFF